MADISDKDLLFTFEFHREGLPAFRVLRFSGHEAVSRLFEFDIMLVSDTGDVDLDAALHATATLRIWSRDHTRCVPYHGMVAELEQQGRVDDYYFYRLSLVPRLWRLRLSRVTDVYLDEYSSDTLVQEVLDNNGLKDFDIQTNFKDDGSAYRRRSFICQYQETDLDFISRWMEHEGMYYFFDHESTPAKDILHIVDFKEAQPDTTITLRYTPPENVQTNRQDTCVTAFTCRRSHVPGRVLVQDFNFRNASMEDELRAVQNIPEGRAGRQMFYGENLRTPEEAARLAQVRVEELACKSAVFHGTAPAIGVRSGGFMEITHHFRDDCNDRYWVTSVSHQGSQTGVVLAGQNTGYNESEQGSLYECRFTALPATRQFRPERLTPKPVATGVLNAIIDANPGSDRAGIDEFGQYRVQLMYDWPEIDRPKRQANKSSSSVRLMTPYSGNEVGMHFPLHKGTEVLIGFVGGDPDQPVIMGAVPNSENKNLVRNENAYCNAIRTHNGNLMNMVDKPDQQVVTMYSPSKGSGIFIGNFPTSGKDVSVPPSSDRSPADVMQDIG